MFRIIKSGMIYYFLLFNQLFYDKIDNMRLLLIEDDQEIIRPLFSALKAASHTTDIANDGERGYFLARTNNYDLIILDYNLPKLNGREITVKLRGEKIKIPIIILSVRSELPDKVELLTLGADDYLTKPFAISELLARIKAISRRPKNLSNHCLKCSNLELDPDKFLVTKNSRRIFLSYKEFILLEYLLRNKGRVIPRQEIMEHVWDENADPFSNTIEVHIMRLRRKLETSRERFIFTFSNRGYKIDERK
jgi:DNA-binding response OmpR family regulator